MAANFVAFTPSTTSPFSFQAQLGSDQYTVTVTWSVFGQRYYVVVSDLSGNIIVNRPLIACGPQLNSAFSWDETGTATATTTAPHNVPLGAVANTIISRTGTGFDGSYQALSTGPNTLTYALASDPQADGVNGEVNFNFNLVSPQIAGAFLIFRYQGQTFEYGASS